MPIKSTKSEKKTIRKASKRDVPVELVITELVVPDEHLAEKEELLEQPEEQPEEQSVEERVEELIGANACAEPLCSVPEEVEGQLVSSSDEEVKPKKTRVLKEGKPLVNDVGDYLNPLTNRYVKVGTTLYKKLIKDGMICVVPV